MKHDLDAINVAWAAGDLRVPPVGSVVEAMVGLEYHKDGDRAIIGTGIVVMIKNPQIQSPVRIRIEAHNRWFGFTQIKRFVSIPDDAPPFGEWEIPWMEGRLWI